MVLKSMKICDTLCICFVCIYQMLVALFGWLPTYQFTFSCLQVIKSGIFRSSSNTGPVKIVTIGDLFNDKYTTDAWVYYICSTAIAVIVLSLSESVRARVILVPVSNWLSQKLMCCSTPDSRRQPPAPALITDDDVRVSLLQLAPRVSSRFKL